MNSRGTNRAFVPALATVAIGAFALRLGYVLVERRDFVPGGDAFFYHASANLLAGGHGFVSPFFYPQQIMPAAEHPPGYTVFLAVASLVGAKSTLQHLIWSCVAGAVTVALVGLLGRRVAGARAGLLAAGLAAVYPNMWAPDGMLQAETLAMLAATAAVFAAYWYLDRPSGMRLAAFGAVCGAAALTRSELLLLVPLMLVPIAVLAGPAGWRPRLSRAALGVVVALAMTLPWTVFNLTRFERPVFLSTQEGPLLSAANCDTTYYGRLRGYFDIQCSIAVGEREGLSWEEDQSVVASVHRRAGLEYMGEHVRDLPEVTGVRLLRIVGLYHPSGQLVIDSFIEGRDKWVARAGLYSFWFLAPFAVAGAVVVRRRRTIPLFPLLAPIASVLITVIATYASTRFRATAEPMIVVLAAVAMDAGLRHARRAMARQEPARK